MDWGFLKYYVQEIREKGKMLYGCVPLPWHFERFKVRFLAKITCSDMFEVRFWWFWKILGPFFINKVREQFGFWWCSRGSKFGFGPKWDVRMCSKFDPLRFGMFKVRFFDVRSTSMHKPFVQLNLQFLFLIW